LTCSQIACYGFCAPAIVEKATLACHAHVDDPSRRAMKWLTVLSMWCLFWAASWSSVPFENRPQAAATPSAVSEAAAPTTERQLSGPRTATGHAAPDKAYEVLEALQRSHGEPLPGYIGGKIFQNRERRLPPGRYKEYDVNRRVPGHSRDAERLVIEQDTGKAFYTDDHYRTFVPLN
jgi:ribonuclease T1